MSTTIAIDCRLDYEIIFPENSKPSTGYQINASLIKLAFNDDIATLPEGITCTLPESLKSQYRVTGVFLDEECTIPLTAGTEISTDDLTGVDTMNGVIIDGALTVYVKVELIPKYLITWKYKTSNNESTQEDTEVFENNLPIPPSFTTNFIVNDNTIPYIYSFETWNPAISVATVNCTYTATYNKIEYKPNTPYLINNISLFEKAEPYYYGSGSPLKNWYLPLGEDNDALTTKDIKIQAPEDNGYSEIGYVEGYQIEGKNIPYIKKGTFPKMGTSSLIGSTNSGTTIRLRVSYDSTNKTITNIEEKTNKLIKFENDLDFYKTLSRIGFMLVGGGGGGGGSSWYDDKAKNKKGHLSFPYPGAGGGGGGILLGILAIDYNTIFKAFTSISKFTTKKSGFSPIGYSGEPKLQYIEYHFIVGGQSDGGKPSESNKMSYGTSGESGKSSKLIRCVASFDYKLYSIDFGNFKNHESFPSMSPQKTPTQDYIYYTDYTIEALGGAGGGAGNHSSAVKGGVGGGYTFPKINNIYKNCVYIVKGITGGNGSGADKESDHNDAPAFNCSLYFSNADASMSEYCTKINHPVRSSITDITNKSNPNKINLSNTVVAGGASYGNGCYKDTSTHTASEGGGGASSGVATNRKGAKGLLALFY